MRRFLLKSWNINNVFLLLLMLGLASRAVRKEVGSRGLANYRLLLTLLPSRLLGHGSLRLSGLHLGREDVVEGSAAPLEALPFGR